MDPTLTQALLALQATQQAVAHLVTLTAAVLLVAILAGGISVWLLSRDTKAIEQSLQQITQLTTAVLRRLPERP